MLLVICPHHVFRKNQVGWEQKASDGHLDGLLRAAGQMPRLRRRCCPKTWNVGWIKNGAFPWDFQGIHFAKLVEITRATLAFMVMSLIHGG